MCVEKKNDNETGVQHAMGCKLNPVQTPSTIPLINLSALFLPLFVAFLFLALHAFAHGVRAGVCVCACVPVPVPAPVWCGVVCNPCSPHCMRLLRSLCPAHPTRA